MKSYKEKLAQITTFIFDIDGVLNNGTVLYFEKEAVRTLNSKDIYAIQHAAKLDYSIFVITRGNSIGLTQKLMSLGVREVCLESANKLHVYDTLKAQYEIADEHILYMGDDIPDFHVMQLAGVSTCPQNAAPEIKTIADYQSPLEGGAGCVRDVIEQTLRVQDKWFKP